MLCGAIGGSCEQKRHRRIRTADSTSRILNNGLRVHGFQIARRGNDLLIKLRLSRQIYEQAKVLRESEREYFSRIIIASNN